MGFNQQRSDIYPQTYKYGVVAKKSSYLKQQKLHFLTDSEVCKAWILWTFTVSQWGIQAKHGFYEHLELVAGPRGLSYVLWVYGLLGHNPGRMLMFCVFCLMQTGLLGWSDFNTAPDILVIFQQHFLNGEYFWPTNWYDCGSIGPLRRNIYNIYIYIYNI